MIPIHNTSILYYNNNNAYNYVYLYRYLSIYTSIIIYLCEYVLYYDTNTPLGCFTVFRDLLAIFRYLTVSCEPCA